MLIANNLRQHSLPISLPQRILQHLSLLQQNITLFQSNPAQPMERYLQYYLKGIMSFLAGRKVLIVGGNGFLGNRVAAKLVQHAANVSVLSRKGPRFEYPENKQINWIIGSAMEPERVKDKINQADTVIHSLGTLFDTTVTKMRSPGQLGTYQQMNRDTFLKVLSTLESPKKVIYISSSNHPPFLPRYLTTKIECEQALAGSKHEGYAIRPGFIYDWDLKKWSIPLRYAIKGWNKVYPSLYSVPRNGTVLQKLLKEFEQGQPSSLNKIAQTIAYLCYKGNEKKILTNDDILQLSQKYERLAQSSKKPEKPEKVMEKQKQKENEEKASKS